MATLTKTQDSKLNKQINEKLMRSKDKIDDFSNPVYHIVDYRLYHCEEEIKGFRNHEEAQSFLDKNNNYYKITTEIQYVDDSGFGIGKYKYLVKEWKPIVHTFNNRGQAYYFLKNNPDVINSDEIEF